MWLDIYFDCENIIKPYRPAYLSQAAYDAKVSLIRSQIIESRILDPEAPDILISCGGCGEKQKVQLMFRCYYCKVYFCQSCASVHFKAASE